ncbi:MAG: hypothetical protein HWD92_10985 [Flavobacteriia bacterium]|nr:hypothetical protein [Flavobacteriia bacterium]
MDALESCFNDLLSMAMLETKSTIEVSTDTKSINSNSSEETALMSMIKPSKRNDMAGILELNWLFDISEKREFIVRGEYKDS